MIVGWQCHRFVLLKLRRINPQSHFWQADEVERLVVGFVVGFEGLSGVMGLFLWESLPGVGAQPFLDIFKPLILLALRLALSSAPCSGLPLLVGEAFLLISRVFSLSAICLPFVLNRITEGFILLF